MSKRLSAGFGRRVRAARKLRGLSCNALAAAAELASGSVSRIERGAEHVEIETAARLSHALEEDLNWLLLGEGKP